MERVIKRRKYKSRITIEIEKDISRLETITERFSKIGSLPKLEEHNIVAQTKEAYEYLKMRSSKLIHFSFNAKASNTQVMLNPSLYHWTIEI